MASLDMEDSCWEQRLRTGERRESSWGGGEIIDGEEGVYDMFLTYVALPLFSSSLH